MSWARFDGHLKRGHDEFARFVEILAAMVDQYRSGVERSSCPLGSKSPMTTIG